MNLSYKATFVLLNGWSLLVGTTVILIMLFVFIKPTCFARSKWSYMAGGLTWQVVLHGRWFYKTGLLHNEKWSIGIFPRGLISQVVSRGVVLQNRDHCTVIILMILIMVCRVYGIVLTNIYVNRVSTRHK